MKGYRMKPDRDSFNKWFSGWSERHRYVDVFDLDTFMLDAYRAGVADTEAHQSQPIQTYRIRLVDGTMVGVSFDDFELADGYWMFLRGGKMEFLVTEDKFVCCEAT